jgi:hypothetical protein
MLIERPRNRRTDDQSAIRRHSGAHRTTMDVWRPWPHGEYRELADHAESGSALLDAVRRSGVFDVRMVHLATGDYLIDRLHQSAAKRGGATRRGIEKTGAGLSGTTQARMPAPLSVPRIGGRIPASQLIRKFAVKSLRRVCSRASIEIL